MGCCCEPVTVATDLVAVIELVAAIELVIAVVDSSDQMVTSTIGPPSVDVSHTERATELPGVPSVAIFVLVGGGPCRVDPVILNVASVPPVSGCG